MRDSEVVASIVAGDPAGLAEAYDRYADALFGYCCSLLREPADAADAVQDTFVIAASRLSGLRDPDLLRPWLFAVARNECLRKLRSRESTTPLDVEAEPADESADVGLAAERAQTRALLLDAVGGLNPAERDVITQLLHGLDVAEIAMVLGISRNHAHSLLSRARDQLEASVAVLLVARSGRQDCMSLHLLLAGWNGELTVPLRKQVSKHISKCAVCGERRRRELTPAMLFGLSPVALLGAAAAHGAAAHGAAAAHGVAASGIGLAAPAALRGKALAMAADQDLHAQAYRGALGRSHPSFGSNGFPKPLHSSHSLLTRVPHGHLAAAAGSAAAVAAAIVLAISLGSHHARITGGGPPGGGPAGGQSQGAPPGTVPGGTPGTAPSGAPSSASGGPGGPASPRASGSGPGATGATGGPSQAPSQAPSPTASRTAPGSGTPSPAPTPSGTPSPQPTPSAQPSPGILTVSPGKIVLTPLLGSTLTLTAENGPVNWSISEPSSLIGELTVSQASGYLGANQSIQVTISVSGLASLDTQLTVNPGGQKVTVVLGLG